MLENENFDIGLGIAEKAGIKIPHKFATRVILIKKISKSLINKWARKKFKRHGKVYWNTYCGQFTSDFYIKAGYDMEPILKGKSLWDINTTGQYKNAIKSVEAGELVEVTAEEAYYLAAIGRPALALSPINMVMDGKNYNHAALIWPIWREKYNPKKGPKIIQQGWHSLIDKFISHRYAWGKNWNHPMVKYFLPGLT